MKAWRIVGILAIVLALASVSFASTFSDKAKMVSWQLFVKEWGRLSAICSAGAYWTDGKVTRLLTASHCITLTRLENGQDVEFIVTQSGAEFLPAKVIATGWSVKEYGASSPGGSAARFLSNLPSPGFLKALSVDSRISLGTGDWAVLEIVGAKPIAGLGDSTKVDEDDPIFMFGYPMGGDRFFARGYIANKSYSAPGTEWQSGYFAADITAKPGNSGSLVIDKDGKGVAILVAGAGDRLNILTPVALVAKALPCFDQPVCPAK